MDNNVMVSVIIPVYNSEKYLHKCIDSVLAQTYENFELLLINDGSNDSSGDICDMYAEKDSRVRVFHKENGGVSSARNMGLDNAKGRFISFIDSDDWVKPKYIETFFEQDNNPEASLAQQGHITISVNGNIINERNYRDKIYNPSDFSDVFSKEQFIRLMPFPWSKLYDSKLIKKHNIRFPLDIHYGEDLLFVLEYIKHIKTFQLQSSNLLYHKLEEDSLSFKINSFESEISRFNIMKEQLDELSSIYNLNNDAVQFNNSYMGRSLFRAISALYYHNDKTKKERREILKELSTSENTQIIKHTDFLGRIGIPFQFIFSSKLFSLLDFYFYLYFKRINLKK